MLLAPGQGKRAPVVFELHAEIERLEWPPDLPAQVLHDPPVVDPERLNLVRGWAAAVAAGAHDVI